MAICSIEECDRPSRSTNGKWCEKHYIRWYRHGDPRATMIGDGLSIATPRRYRRIKAVGHPLAHRDGTAYEHRLVLWDEIGPGSHPCYWCRVPVSWFGTPQLQVDHLDGDKGNNVPSNLVPACRSCNGGRVQTQRMALRAEAGWHTGIDSRRPQRKQRLEQAAIAAALTAPRTAIGGRGGQDLCA